MDELMNSIRSGNLTSVHQMLSGSPELANQPDSRGFTPLIMATYLGNKQMSELLINLGADVNARDAAGNTALMGICFKGTPEMAALLLSHGADVNLQNKNGTTALIFAINFDQVAMAKLLISKGADLSIVDNEGKDAYAHIKLKGNPAVMTLLDAES